MLLLVSAMIILQSISFAAGSTYEDSKQSADANVEKLYPAAISDPTIPKYHLRAPANWINDPCGLFYFNSSFHVFCQSNPWGNQWGNMSWSHIVSVPDKKWDYKWFYPEENNRLKTTVIAPSLNRTAPDRDGIFTGSIMVLPFTEKDNKGKNFTTYYPTAFYSGVWGTGESKQEVVCMARALDANLVDKTGKLIDPFLTNWTKYSSTSKTDPDNYPDIIIPQPAELDLVSFRDPYIFTLPDDKSYYMLLSGGIKNETGRPTGAVPLYRNDGEDLTKNWVRVNHGNNFFFSGPVEVKDPVTGGGDFECACIYKLTDHIGTTNNTPYVIIFGQDGPPGEYGKAGYYVLGNIEKSSKGMQFKPLNSFKNEEDAPLYRHLDLNPDFIFYAPNTLPVDNEQRKYLIGWLNIGSQANDRKHYCWAGVLSSPRFLYAYRENNEWKLAQQPVLVTALRDDKVLHASSMKFISNKPEERLLHDVTGRYINIESEFSGSNLKKSTFGLRVLSQNLVNLDIIFKDGKLIIDGKKKLLP